MLPFGNAARGERAGGFSGGAGGFPHLPLSSVLFCVRFAFSLLSARSAALTRSSSTGSENERRRCVRRGGWRGRGDAAMELCARRAPQNVSVQR
eukprot:1862286-Pyramimonas_sp.AAC.1